MAVKMTIQTSGRVQERSEKWSYQETEEEPTEKTNKQ